MRGMARATGRGGIGSPRVSEPLQGLLACHWVLWASVNHHSAALHESGAGEVDRDNQALQVPFPGQRFG